jgi:hypothetical protein
MLMRKLLTIPLALGVFCAATAVAAPPAESAGASSSSAASSDTTIPAFKLPKVVFLSNARALDELRISNPAHYARAKRILADADQICRPGKLQVVPLQLDARDVGCARSLIFTSYPPQRQLRFRLDDTTYVAMVFLTETAAKLTPLLAPAATLPPSR